MSHIRTVLSAFVIGLSLLTTTPASALVWYTQKTPTRSPRRAPKVTTPIKKPITRELKKKVIWSEKMILRNNQRKKDATTIANAIFVYRRDRGETPKDIPLAAPGELCRSNATTCAGLVDLRDEFRDILDDIPVDPSSPADGNGTGYFVQKDWRGRSSVTAPLAEDEWFIRVQK